MTASLSALWFAVADDAASNDHLRARSRRGLEAAAEADVPHDVWLERIRAGDMVAFTDVYIMYAERLATYARAYVPDQSTAEEIAHDVLASLWHHRTARTIRSTLLAYLYGAVRLAALKWVRGMDVRDRYLSAAASEAVAQAAAPDDPAEEQLWEARRAALVRAVDDLPPRCREVFLLRWRDELPYTDVAAVLGISVKTVEMQMTLAVKRLRAQLSGLEIE